MVTKKISFRNFAFAFFLLLVSFNSVGAQCPNFDLSISSQADINDFSTNWPNCTELTNRLTIEGPNISNLNGLSQITSIASDLNIRNCSNLASLTGLNNLVFVDEFILNNCDQLTDLQGLNSLESFGAFYIQAHNNLTSLNGLDVIAEGDFLSIRNNPELSTCAVFQNISELERLALTNNPKITDLTCFSGLTKITNALTISSSNGLTDFDGLQNVTEFGTISVSLNPGIVDFNGLENVTQVGQFISIKNNLVLSSITQLANADLSNMDVVEITGNTALTECAMSNFCAWLPDHTSNSISFNGQSCQNQTSILNSCASLCTVGDPCDDNNDCTVNDIYDSDCNCVGTALMEGDACDDGDTNTTNDQIQADNCTCAGTTNPGAISCDDIVVTFDTTSITITGLTTINSEIQLIDEDYNDVYYCYHDCQATTVIDNLAGGEYELKIKVWDANYDLVCDLDQLITIGGGPCVDMDDDGVCAEDDCDDNDANFPMAEGTACDDGDAATTNDQIQADGCTCAGTTPPSNADCNNVVITNDDTSITVAGLDAPIVELNIYDENYNSTFYCIGTCNPTEVVAGLGNLTYTVKVKYFDLTYDLICEIEVELDLAGGPCVDMDDDGVCAEDDCDDNDANFPMAEGTACDDGDAATTNDQIQADGCTCAGTTPPSNADCNDVVITNDDTSITVAGLDAPIVELNIYDENYNSTFYCLGTCNPTEVVSGLGNLTYTVKVKYFDLTYNLICEIEVELDLAGGPCVDMDDDGICAEDDCDDNDANFPMAEGTACDDGDAATTNDQIQADGCTCTGTTPPSNADCNDVVITNDGTSITVAGLDAPIVELNIYDENYNSTFYCIGTCNPTEVVSGLGNLTYTVKVKYFDLTYDLICEIEVELDLAGGPCVDMDDDGVCAEDDCDDNDANFPMAEGTACDDGDAATSNDQIQADGCTCAGDSTTPDGDCDDLTILVDGDNIIVSGLDATAISMLEIFDEEWDKIYKCKEDCNPTETISGLEEGTYFLLVTLIDEDWNEICDLGIFVTIEPMQIMVSNPQTVSGTGNTNTGGISIGAPGSGNSFSGVDLSDSKMTVYPNPAIDTDLVFVNLNGLENQSTQIQVYNNLGKLIFHEEINNQEDALLKINLANIPGGLYLINLNQKGKKTISEKLILTRD